MNLVWFLLAVIFQLCLVWISLIACKKKGLKKKNGKKGKTAATTKDEEEEGSNDSDGKKKGGKEKGKIAPTKKGKKGKGKKGDTEITEDPDLKSRDDYGVTTGDESMKHLKK